MIMLLKWLYDCGIFGLVMGILVFSVFIFLLSRFNSLVDIVVSIVMVIVGLVSCECCCSRVCIVWIFLGWVFVDSGGWDLIFGVISLVLVL